MIRKAEGQVEAPTLGGKLWELLRGAEMSTGDVAAAAAMTRQQVWRILNGDVENPGILTVQRMVLAMGCRMEDLFGGGPLVAGGGRPEDA